MSRQLSWNIIKRFSCKNVFGFTVQDVSKEFPEKNRSYLVRLLTDMVDKGMLCKIARDIYHIVPLNVDPETYVPDSLQVAKYLTKGREYYIGYTSALKIHGLALRSESTTTESTTTESTTTESTTSESTTSESTTTESMKSEAIVYVVTNKQMKQPIRSIGGITYQFIHHNAILFFGFTSMWINKIEEAMVSDLERTIVDIATRPRLCGGIVEVGNALFRANERTDFEKLFYYLARNRNKSAIKRLLFLTDLLGLEWNVEHERMMGELGKGISLLDPAAPDEGRIMKKFGLKINVDTNRVKEIILH